MKKLVLILTLALVSGILADTRPNVPTPTMGQANQQRGNCKVPEFLVNIPPMMQNDYTECVNSRYEPSRTLVEVVLKQQVSEKAEFVKIEVAPRFYTRVYKVTYKIGNETKAMICNDSMTYCLDDKPIVSRER